MATSIYFRFTPSHRNNPVHQSHRITNITTNTEIPPNTIINDTRVNEQRPAHSMRPICRYCHRQVCGLKIDALRGDFLATLSDSLLNRVHRLERDLSFAENNAKNAKGARDNLAKRLQAYEAFVAEMLRSLSVRGTAKITDENGMEIVLQRVNENDRLANGGAIKGNSLLEHEITALKSLLKEQQQTIQKLVEQMKFNDRQEDRINFMDREIQTISCPFAKSPRPMQHPMESRKNDEQKLNEGNDEKAMERIVKTQPEKDVEECRISSGAVPEPTVLKIPKPSGILVQGKDVKFAIVRF